MPVSLNKLAQAVDKYYETRECRLALDKQAAEMKKKESELKQFLIDNISKSDATGVSGQLMRATVKTTVEPTPEDWPSIYKYILKKKEFDLLQRRLSVTAVRERWDQDIEINGIGKIVVPNISLTKI